uniref:Anthocyanidin 5,3-O-glucosyltransferase n=1 Tax=Aegilops tauschii TaxID=37682 RepID=M8AUL8_AEGTA
MEKKTVVLYPGLSVSHFVPMMRLAGPLLDHGYAVSVALIDTGVKQVIAFNTVVGRVAASMPSVRFHTLPAVEDPPKLAQDGQFVLTYLHLVSRYNERLHDFLCSMRVHAVVVDSLSNAALAVVKRLGIPGYTLFTSSAATFVAFAQLPTVLAESGASFKELGDTPLELFGLPPMPASHLSGDVLEDPESDTYKAMMALLCRIPEADGTLVNTFESLEARAVAALRDPRGRDYMGTTEAWTYCKCTHTPLTKGDNMLLYSYVQGRVLEVPMRKTGIRRITDCQNWDPPDLGANASGCPRRYFARIISSHRPPTSV